MKPYHPNNLGLTPHPHWKIIILAWAGKVLGVQFHVSGIPFGGNYKPDFYPVDDKA